MTMPIASNKQYSAGQTARGRRIPVEVGSVERLLTPARSAGDIPSTRDLRLQALLHLPRIADSDGTVDLDAAIAEIERLHELRAGELAPLRSLARPPAKQPTLAELDVSLLEAREARPILDHFHYLRSYREDSLTVGALYRGRVAAICSISPLDLPLLTDPLPTVGRQEVMVISRVFAFDWAPRNVVSYLLARAEKTRAVSERGRLLLTYLNPNLGFAGASYKAANWLPYGREKGTRYAYLRGCYITDRRIARLPSTERKHVEYSQMSLRPLILLCRPLDKRLYRSHVKGFHFIFERSKLIG